MATNSKLNFDIYARDHASPVFDKFGRKVDQSSKSVGGMGSATKKMFAGFAGLAVVSKAVGFLRSANEEARESQKVNALTANALKTTGASAWQSVKGVSALSTAISNKTGVDDEAIQSAANLLITFKNVRNEVGKGSKIFDRATAASQDMAASFGGTASTQAMKLGKALNDPIKGLSALNKIGIKFTEGQEKQIEAMVEAGDTLGAQKLIMKEVESQVKGSAAAQATSAEKLKVSWGNFKEEIGTGLLPVLDKMAIAGTKAIEWMSKNPAAVYGLAAAVGVLGVAFIIATAPISLTALAIAALVGGLIYAYNKFGWFKTGVDFAFKAIGAVATWLWNNAFQPMVKNIVTGIGLLLITWGKMLQGLSKVPGFGWAKKAGDAMVGAGQDALEMRDNIKKIPKTWSTKITTPGMGTAISQAQTLLGLLKGVSKQKNVNVTVPGQFNPGENARGTNNWRGGLTWVGERGPEIVDLPQGSKVIPAHKSDKYVENRAARSAAARPSAATAPLQPAGLTRRDLIEILANASVKIQGGGNLKITLAGG